MKHTLFLAAISAFLFSGCGGSKTEEHTQDGTHKHGEGTHEHHDNDTAQHHQEAFTVDTTIKEEAHDHPHNHAGHDHKH